MKIGVFSALAALGLLAHAGPSWASSSRGGTITVLPIDSLLTEDIDRAKLVAPDELTLQVLHQGVDLASRQFVRYLGYEPPKIGVAALGSLRDPSKVNVAALRELGVDHILTDWPAGPPGPGRPANLTLGLGGTSIADLPLPSRAARWFLLAHEKKEATVTPPFGKRLVPDWFDSMIGQLAMLPVDQQKRLAWFHQRLDQRFPVAKFLEMSRPGPPPAPGTKRATAKTSARPPARGAARADSLQLFEGQALSFGRFLVARESDGFPGHVLELLLTGQPQSAALNIAKTMLTRPDVLEKEWVTWVEADSSR